MTRSRPPRFLVVEDQDVDFTLLCGICSARFPDSEFKRIESQAELRSELARGYWDLIISDYNLPTMTGSDSLRIVRELSPEIPVIVVSGMMGEDTAVKVMREGARDYLLKRQLARLPEAIARELKHAEEHRDFEALQKATILNEKLTSVGRMAAVMSHEIASPLTVVMTNLEAIDQILSRPASAEHDVREPLEKAREGAVRMLSVVRNMKCFLHPGQESLGSRTTPVFRILEQAVSSSSSVVESRTQVRIIAPAQLFVPTDESKLLQVLVNLITNAAQAQCREKSATNWIELGARAEAREVHITVSDNGHGIAPANLDKLFKYGFTTKCRGEGMGFGLALSKDLITELGGRIGVRSELGRGTTFEIVLPNAVEACEFPRSGVAKAQVATPPRSRALVVDDDSSMLDLLQEMLYGIVDVDVASSLEEAKNLLRHGRRYDLILSDWDLTVGNGGMLYSELKTESSHLCERMIFMTGGVYTKEAREFFQCFDSRRLLDKPFNLQSLLRVIQYVQTNA